MADLSDRVQDYDRRLSSALRRFNIETFADLAEYIRTKGIVYYQAGGYWQPQYGIRNIGRVGWQKLLSELELREFDWQRYRRLPDGAWVEDSPETVANRIDQEVTLLASRMERLIHLLEEYKRLRNG